jgi:glycosyltransferase involved in cell wall biosynthesis
MTQQMRIDPNSLLVSVIIPTWNRGWTIKSAVDSVLSQTLKSYELIIVNDGSTDNTADILNEYASRITVIHQPNRGVSAARNKGIAHSSGELLAFLDSDDRWLPEKLERQTAFMEANPRLSICQTEEIWIRNGVRVNPKKKHRKPSGMMFEPSLALCLISPSAVMIRRHLLDEVGLFDENLPACEDYDLWLRITCRHPVGLLDIPLIEKRGGHDDQLSRAPSLDKYRIQSLKKIIESEILSQSQRATAIEMLKTKCGIYAQGCLKRGRNEEAGYYRQLMENFQQVPKSTM